MNKQRKLAWCLVGLFGALALGSQAWAGDGCRKVNATLKGGFTGALSTAGEITGGGRLNGTTAFTGDGLAPAAGVAPIVPESTASYTGVLVITTRHGTLSLRDVGIFDTDVAGGDGEFTSRARVIDGTGRFAGATGILFFHGDTAEDFTFKADVSGEICPADSVL